ncbi:hypothetical protein PtrSN002B_001990 [Pyrenophora tritici-repentis]|uniref:Uncharacterized protein n=1 Tax=Pyrenophora tritici-repentis TaxID=45151 RepID=A0A2W1F8V0_9PLEO|nr:hypothetical protein PtrV1_03651 [Pyrenophora tritici-repentis]KAF7575567.1 hypothetical protein PtrM4_071910 [Pyrenophora tritici-repentis]KAI0575023.1 hypothetical protein Alg215_08256 [Pyrenophora tritici-repentis]KAI0612173.1 hypothetical protein TUN205_03614 [Pyrenophora tritici-repentis]KAI1514691.1 hypothetical protein Ptr86124_006014 [Pyrenophora tritici-repentis]
MNIWSSPSLPQFSVVGSSLDQGIQGRALNTIDNPRLKSFKNPKHTPSASLEKLNFFLE